MSLLAPAALTPLAAYAADLAGVAFTPLPMAALAAMAFLFCGALLFRRAKPDGVGLMLGAAAGALLLAWLLWLSAPSLLPLGTGPDLTHHLMLVRHIETHWRLVHDPALEQSLGEMAHYTPGSHILVALAGAWSGTDGLRAMHGVQAWTVALKAVFLVAVCLRLLPPRAPRLLAALGPVLLLESPRYFLGGFTEFGFLAQVVAELPAVAMWWALVAWADSRADLALGVFGAAGAAAFLAWPVYVGPPALAAGVLIASRGRRPFARRVRDLAVAFAPLALVAAAFAIGRLGWLRLAGTGGLAPWPSIAAYGRPLVVLSAAGLLVAAARERGRATVGFALAVLIQAAALCLVARRAGAPQPYMALKMGYLLLWPMAACAVAAAGEAWAWLDRTVRVSRAWGNAAAVLVAASALALAARPLLARPRLLHPRPPAVSLPLYEAGRWARARLPASCVEYLVGDDETAYWLHLAVLGNPRASARSADNSTYEPADAIVRWLTPNGLPYALVDLPALPRDVRSELDVMQSFGTAAIARRRGPSACAAAPRADSPPIR
ncbi:MAG TPA: hypothetical protein PLE61_10990 [Vicinamibacterales bacterium]|nr:hypothetical protein [Vicinamibacterales bacterium]HPW21324.1 hypothetical protein [Vicinamibacterales bacterium]